MFSNFSEIFKLSEEQVKILEDEVALYTRNPGAGSSWEDVKKRIISGNKSYSSYSSQS